VELARNILPFLHLVQVQDATVADPSIKEKRDASRVTLSLICRTQPWSVKHHL